MPGEGRGEGRAAFGDRTTLDCESVLPLFPEYVGEGERRHTSHAAQMHVRLFRIARRSARDACPHRDAIRRTHHSHNPYFRSAAWTPWSLFDGATQSATVLTSGWALSIATA